MSSTEVPKSDTHIQNSLPPQQQQNNGDIGVTNTTTPERIIHNANWKRRTSLQYISKKDANANGNDDLGETEISAPSGEVQQQKEPSAVDVKVTTASNDSKNAYWYYDPKSDGFYYYWQGSRGWRRRNPALERKYIQAKGGLSRGWMDPNLVHYSGTGPLGYQYGNINSNFSPYCPYYGSRNGGYYFQKPFVNSRKKWQPYSSTDNLMPSLSEHPNNKKMSMKLTMSPPSANNYAVDVPPTSCDVALSKGQLIPSLVTTTSTTTSYITGMLYDKISENSEKGNCEGGSTLKSCDIQRPLSYAEVVAKSCNKSGAVIAGDAENNFASQKIIRKANGGKKFGTNAPKTKHKPSRQNF